MQFRAGLDEQIGRLVHPMAQRSPVDAARHSIFIATRLSVAFGALAFIPFYLVGGGVPGWVEACVLAWLILPVIAVVHVSTTGELVRGEIVSLGTWIGLATTVFFGRVCGIGPAMALLLLVPLEASLVEAPRIAKSAIAVAAATALLLLATAGSPSAANVALYAADTPVLLFAIVYGGWLSCHGLDLRRLNQQRGASDALRFAALSEAVGDMVIRFNRAGAVLVSSHALERAFGLKPRELIGRGFFDRVHVADRPAFLKLISDAAAAPGNMTGNFRLRVSSAPSEDGRYEEPIFAWIETRARRLANDGSEDVSVLAVIGDITTRIRHEAEVEQGRRDAEQASAWKDRFLATVSHELRTPLNAIIGFSEILSSDVHAPKDGAKRREYAEIVHSSGQHLLSVVNSLLDMTTINAGKFELTLEPFDVAGLVDACCDMIRLKAEQSRIDLIRDVPPGLPELVGDKRACKQIVINLLSNALKFTPEYGSVTIAARLDGDMIELVVTDTGIGMRAADLARLGDPFFQAQNSYDRPYEGTGLGLSVVNGLVGLQGGTIAAESALGEGTCMTVRLPRDGRDRPAASPKARIEVMSRHARPTAIAAAHISKKVQKIA